MSVEETNKLRLSLGLKPLALGPSKKEQAVVSVQKSSAQLAAEREQQELKRKLQQSRTRRELTQKLAGKSLGEQLKADLAAQKKGQKKCSHDALDWVKQSRSKKEEKDAGVKIDKTKEENYDAAALAGMTVGHALDTFEDGQEVVLTLKDARVLGEDGNDLNDAEDELVNVELSEKDRRMEHQARAKRAAMPVYSGYDDDEFIEMGSSRKRKSASKLLAQYDEEEDVAEAAAARKFRLDASGGSAAVESEGKQEEEDDVAVVSLSMDRTKQAEDYYTKEEVEAQFAKHKKSKKLRKKKKRSRRHHDEDLGENDAVEVQLNGGTAEEEGGDAASLVAQLEQEAMQAGASGSKDRGKRKRSRRDDDEDPEEEENLLRFQEAREKANAVASEALAASSGKRRMKRRPVDDSEIVDDAAAIEMELGASLARARQLAQQQTQKQAPIAPTTSEARIAQLVSQTISEEDTTPVVATDSAGAVIMDSSVSTNVKPVGHVFGEVGTAANTVVFNEATDFETRLRDAMEKRAAQFQAGGGGTAVPTIPAPDKPQQDTVAEEQKHEDDMDVDGETKEEDDDDEETKENEVWGEEQPLVGTGMGATLALLRKTGDLRQTRVERQAGRANDARDRSFEDDLRIKNGVKLDYRDEFGRLLTKKEAFRMLSSTYSCVPSFALAKPTHTLQFE
ncbi:U4/U6.U5 tri-snRNP-associated protein [Phytophthora cinnamomi]|uniref:U4/U6.U5 tri-snRNP-associated protein n=1 Tax=Phytophthora cinnamomi TaxID=4785 RepID=UPI003559A344|nr:U4/U6.U5 tri-snRNP-associated protein [Phytophthora cinnamomi]